jgi:hypothetical protein
MISSDNWPHLQRFKGGGGSSTPVIQAPPAPAASQTAVEVTQAKLDAKRAAKAKGGISSTILAGGGLFSADNQSSKAQQGMGTNVLLGQ